MDKCHFFQCVWLICDAVVDGLNDIKRQCAIGEQLLVVLDISPASDEICEEYIQLRQNCKELVKLRAKRTSVRLLNVPLTKNFKAVFGKVRHHQRGRKLAKRNKTPPQEVAAQNK